VLLLERQPSPSRPRLDVPGVILVSGGVFCLVYGWSNAATHRWGTPSTHGFLAAGGVFLVLFALWQDWAPHPLLPPGVVLFLDPIPGPTGLPGLIHLQLVRHHRGVTVLDQGCRSLNLETGRLGSEIYNLEARAESPMLPAGGEGQVSESHGLSLAVVPEWTPDRQPWLLPCGLGAISLEGPGSRSRAGDVPEVVNWVVDHVSGDRADCEGRAVRPPAWPIPFGSAYPV
jgi:hypothetical protein